MSLLRRLKDILPGFFGSPKDSGDPDPDPRVLPVRRYWALRKSFREQGVWKDVIQDEIRHGELPVYDYPEGTTVAVLDRNGDPRIETLGGRRLWVPMYPTRFEDEPAYLEELREALPDADEVRVVSEPPCFINGTIVDTRTRGYWAVKYPEGC